MISNQKLDGQEKYYINDIDKPQIAEIQKVGKFFNSISYLGSYSTKEQTDPNIMPVKYMNFQQKIDHI